MSLEVTGTAVVTRRGLRKARAGRPWLKAEDIVSYEGDGGPFVDLTDETSLPMGTAIYDPLGPAPVRLLSSARTRDPVGLLKTRIERAYTRRVTDLDGAAAGRLLHGEADGVPALFVDRFGPGVLVTVDGAAMARIVVELVDHISTHAEAEVVALARDDNVTLAKGESAHLRFLHGRLELSLDIAAPGVRHLSADLQRQLDLRRWAKGRVLDLFAGVGGYGLQLGEAGANEVTFVDDAAMLAATIEDDAHRNGIRCGVLRTPADPLAWLRSATAEGNAAPAHYDVVVFHPRPQVDERQTAVARALEHGALCLSLLSEGGILAASSASLGLDDLTFAEALQDAAANVRKRLQVVARYGAGPDHPVLAGVKPPPSLLVTRVLTTG